MHDTSAATLTDAEIQQLLVERVENKRVNSSIIMALTDANGVHIYSKGKIAGEGSPSPNATTVYEIGSLTKVFTSLLLADMAVKGELKLDDPVALYLPKQVNLPVRNSKPIRLIDLATHMSGLPRVPDNFTGGGNAQEWERFSVEDLYAFLNRYQPTRDVGEKEEYSNVGVALLGHALARRGGKDYQTLIGERIIQPLGMRDTWFDLPKDQDGRLIAGHDEKGSVAPHMNSTTLAPTGMLRSTINDMLLFLHAAMGKTDTSLKKAFDLMRAPVPAKADVLLAWGLVDQFDSLILWHQGRTYGFASYMGIDLSNDRAVIILSNTKHQVTDIGFKTLNREHDLLE